MANSAEYNTIIANTNDLRLAVQFNLVSLSGTLLAKRLISAENDIELRYPQHTDVERAAKLVGLVQNKVQQNSQHFYTFLDVLRRDKEQYADILRKLNQSLSSKTNSRESKVASINLAIKEHDACGAQAHTEDQQTNYRGELNHLLQTEQIQNLDYSFEEKCDATSQRMKHKCTISLKHSPSGQIIVGTSSLVERKSMAQEQASEKAVKQIRNVERRRRPVEATDTGITPSSSKAKKPSGTTSFPALATIDTVTPTSKIWKSKLKEHLDRQYKHNKISIDYETEEHPKGGFKSTVICGDIVRAEGLGTNKGIAEHNAAYNALKKLPN